MSISAGRVQKTRFCPEHNISIHTANWARHQATCHKRGQSGPTSRPLEEYCEAHGWFSYSNRGRHYRRLHGGIFPQTTPSRRLRPGKKCVTGSPQPSPPLSLLDHHPIAASSNVQPSPQPSPDRLSPDSYILAASFDLRPSPRGSPRPSSPSISSLIDDLHTATEAAIQYALHQIDSQLRQSSTGYTSRLQHELPRYRQSVDKAVPGNAITFQQYTEEELWKVGPCRSDQRHRFLVCTDVEARRALELGCPPIPIIVPSQTPVLQKLSLDEYLLFLQSQRTLDVHTYDQEIDEDGRFLQPRSLSGEEGVEQFRSSTSGAVNFLSLSSYRENPFPSCITNLPSENILNTVARRLATPPRDKGRTRPLSSSLSFQICGKAGAYSDYHRDHHGVLTTIFCDEGEKLWLVCPHLSGTQLKQWGKSGGDPADLPSSLALFLRPGDLLIQPPGRLHAPYTLHDCLMSGTFHWSVQDMASVVERSIFELRWPHITNEDPAPDFCPILSEIQRLWEGGLGPWEWPGQEELSRFQKLIKEYRQTARRKR